jgi:LmbE family N-acetylglucosaminyl deacetylase
VAKLSDRVYYKITNLMKSTIQNRYISTVANFINRFEVTYPKEFEFTSSDKILLLAPHADDESIGAASLMLKYPSNLKVVCVTDGRYGDDSLKTDELIKIRESEFSEAMRFCGVEEYSFLGVEDTKVLESIDKFDRLNLTHYDYIFLPNYLDQHQDHKAIALIVKNILKSCKRVSKIKVVFYEVWATLPYMNAYIDLSDIVDKKRELINIYKSQMKFVKYDDRIIALNQYRGMLPQKEFVEAFFVVSMDKFFEIVE